MEGPGPDPCAGRTLLRRVAHRWSTGYSPNLVTGLQPSTAPQCGEGEPAGAGPVWWTRCWVLRKRAQPPLQVFLGWGLPFLWVPGLPEASLGRGVDGGAGCCLRTVQWTRASLNREAYPRIYVWGGLFISLPLDAFFPPRCSGAPSASG